MSGSHAVCEPPRSATAYVYPAAQISMVYPGSQCIPTETSTVQEATVAPSGLGTCYHVGAYVAV